MHLQPGKQSPVQSQCPFLFRGLPICSPLELAASVFLASYTQGLPTRKCATWPNVFSVSSAGTQKVLIGILYFRDYKRNMSRFSLPLHCCRVPCPLISCTQKAISMEHMGISACRFQSSSKPGMGIFLMDINMSYFNASFEFQ